MRMIMCLCFFLFMPIGFAQSNGLLQKIERLEHQDTQDTFFTQHQLVFFFSSTCPHCHNAAPHLRVWAGKHHAEVMAVSFDGQPLLDFPHIVEVSDAFIQTAFAGQPITTPALFIMNTQTNQLYPAMIGEWTRFDLERRLAVLIEKIKHYEARHG